MTDQRLFNAWTVGLTGNRLAVPQQLMKDPTDIKPPDRLVEPCTLLVTNQTPVRLRDYRHLRTNPLSRVTSLIPSTLLRHIRAWYSSCKVGREDEGKDHYQIRASYRRHCKLTGKVGKLQETANPPKRLFHLTVNILCTSVSKVPVKHCLSGAL
jgi:hypothetical protein